VIALTVTTCGIPMTIQMFEGDTFERHTIIPSIEETKNKFSLTDIIVVADAAMLSEDNLRQLETKQMKYIVAARLGNISNELFGEIILKLPKKDGASIRVGLPHNRILLVNYSLKRAAKDKHDREKQIERAKEMLLKPQSVIRRYKFITSKDKGQYKLNQKLIEKTEQLEGIKGYVTNAAELKDEQIIEEYNKLWLVEKLFRMSKPDLKARPVFHSLKQSIEVHLLIVFTALVISRYIEYVTKQSIHAVLKVLREVKEIVVEDDITKQQAKKLTNLSHEASLLLKFAKLGSLKK